MTELEIMHRAKMYMEKLAQGIDPISDQEIPEDSVLNNVRLARCSSIEKLNSGWMGSRAEVNLTKSTRK